MCPSHAAIYSDTGIALIMTLWSCCEMVGIIALTALESAATGRIVGQQILGPSALQTYLVRCRFSHINRLSPETLGLIN